MLDYVFKRNGWDWIEDLVRRPLAVAIWGIVSLVAIADLLTGGWLSNLQRLESMGDKAARRFRRWIAQERNQELIWVPLAIAAIYAVAMTYLARVFPAIT